jgi:hypothetical protein
MQSETLQQNVGLIQTGQMESGFGSHKSAVSGSPKLRELDNLWIRRWRCRKNNEMARKLE